MATHYEAKHSYKKNIKNNKNLKKKSKASKIFFIIIRLAFITAIILSTINLIKWNNDNKANSELTEHLYSYVSFNEEEPEKSKIDFEGLKQENEFFFAWLVVNGTNINYPVVHYKNNDYYLNHSFNNASNEAGCPFADYRDKCNGTDKNLVIYAHNRKDRKYVLIIKKHIKK